MQIKQEMESRRAELQRRRELIELENDIGKAKLEEEAEKFISTNYTKSEARDDSRAESANQRIGFRREVAREDLSEFAKPLNSKVVEKPRRDSSIRKMRRFEELKKCCDKILKIDSRWLVPGGGCKSFENEDITIRWYSTNNSLIIKGQDGESLRNELKLIANPMDESVGDSQDDELISAEGDGDSIASTQIHGKVDEVVQSEESPQVTAKDPSDYVYFQNQVIEIKSNLDQHIDKTRAELQRIEESLADQFDQLK